MSASTNTITVIDTSGITVTTVGTQGLAGPNTILNRDAVSYTHLTLPTKA